MTLTDPLHWLLLVAATAVVAGVVFGVAWVIWGRRD